MSSPLYCRPPPQWRFSMRLPPLLRPLADLMNIRRARKGPYRRAPPAPLRIEQLEDRTVPSVMSGVGAIGDSYTVARGGNNWTEQLAVSRGFNFGASHPVS